MPAQRSPPKNVSVPASPPPPPTVSPQQIISQLKWGWKGVEHANWEIIARVTRHTLNPGESIEMHLYLCGYGMPEWAKLSFYPPLGLFEVRDHPEFGYQGQGAITLSCSVSLGTEPGVPRDPIPLGATVRSVHENYVLNMSEHGSTSTVNLGNFFPLFVSSDPRGSTDFSKAVPDPGRKVVGEVDMTDYLPNGEERRAPPMVIRARVSRTTSGGDYSLPVTMSYETAGTVKASTSRLEFHVRSFWEKQWFQAVIGFSAAVAIVGGSLAFASALGVFHP